MLSTYCNYVLIIAQYLVEILLRVAGVDLSSSLVLMVHFVKVNNSSKLFDQVYVNQEDSNMSLKPDLELLHGFLDVGVRAVYLGRNGVPPYCSFQE